jgi:hypothetical protein
MGKEKQLPLSPFLKDAEKKDCERGKGGGSSAYDSLRVRGGDASFGGDGKTCLQTLNCTQSTSQIYPLNKITGGLKIKNKFKFLLKKGKVVWSSAVFLLPRKAGKKSDYVLEF